MNVNLPTSLYWPAAVGFVSGILMPNYESGIHVLGAQWWVYLSVGLICRQVSKSNSKLGEVSRSITSTVINLSVPAFAITVGYLLAALPRRLYV
jgi:hypothetical protein